MLPLHLFRSFIEKNRLFLPHERVLLAISSGKDSVFMAYLFNAAGLEFGIAHCNFQLRGAAADADEQFAGDLAKRFDVPFYSTRFATGEYAETHKVSVQMAARELRYRWLEEIRESFSYQYIALAHHLSDSTETVIFNLARGTGIRGLHGILPKRDKLIRPLLFLTGQEIGELVIAGAIPYREDESNYSDTYSRNKIRHQVVPVLKTLNPQLDQTFVSNSRHFAEVEEFLHLQVTALRDQLFSTYGEGFAIELAALKQLYPLNLLLFELFRPYGFSEEVLGDLSQSFDKHPGRQFFSSGYRIVLDREKILLEQLGTAAPAETLVNETDELFYWGGKKFSKSQQGATEKTITRGGNTAFADADMLVYPLKIRSWKTGDTFIPLGMQGQKKISDFFISMKIPTGSKAAVPILENGNGEVIWIAGYRLNEKYKVGGQTKKVTIFESYE